MTSPYKNLPEEEWSLITARLIDEFPLPMHDLCQVVLISWDRLWKTLIGESPVVFPIEEIEPPATVIGYMLEKLIAKELAQRSPNVWATGKRGSDKDILNLTNNYFSFEIKTSGQAGTKIFGNRSYGQKLQNENEAKKDKSGYYLTVNFHGKKLNLIRFGWIDSFDWHSQSASSGQMASLDKKVYEYKLAVIKDKYLQDSELYIIDGLGKKAVETLGENGVNTLGDILKAKNLPQKLLKYQEKAINDFGDILK